MKKGKLYSISISTGRGQIKSEIPQAKVIKNYGIEDDGHAGSWDRQVTCLNLESVIRVNKENHLNAGPGDFAENLLIEGLEVNKVKVTDRIRIGPDVILLVTQIGKEDHPSIVTQTLGISLLPYEGLFCRVIQGGILKKGDTVEVI